MPQVIQFIHPEVNESSLNENLNLNAALPYSNPNQKFILSNGKYLENGNNVKSDLTFWADWKGKTEIHSEINNRDIPVKINKTYIDQHESNNVAETIPYVFGKTFSFMACKKCDTNSIWDLDPNSLVLFGSSYDGKFYLDTVFLVSGEKNIYIFPDEENAKSINKNCNTNCNSNSSEYIFYKGIDHNHSNSFEGLYSFVPCKEFNPKDETESLFGKPQIELDILNKDVKAGPNTCNGNDFKEADIIHYWSKISEQVEKQGLLKGIHFDQPEIKN